MATMTGRGLVGVTPMTEPYYADDHEPAPGEVILEADWTEHRDHFGRLQFAAYWWPGRHWNPEQPSAQIFYASPEEHAALWEEQGYTVRVEQPRDGHR